MHLQKIDIAKTRISIEARQRKAEVVTSLAESMSKIGLINPITVIVATYTGGGRADNQGYVVVAGGHRLDAARMLGWEEIDAFVMDCAVDDYKKQRLVEISENLHRAELSALERDKLVAEWCELVGKQVRQDDAPDPRYEKRGTREASRQLGLSEPDVRRSRKVASLSEPAQEKARELGLDDNRSALLEAAKETEPEEQVRKLEQRADRKPEQVSRVDKVLEMVRTFSKDEMLELLAKLTGIVEARN